LLNTVQGDFTRTLESFAPLANAAAQAILMPLSSSLSQLSKAASVAFGEQDRVRKQLEDAKASNANAQSIAALGAKLSELNAAARDPAIANQAKDIEKFVTEVTKAARAVSDFTSGIGSILGPIFTTLGTNLTGVVNTLGVLALSFAATRAAAMLAMGTLTTMNAVVKAGATISTIAAARATILAGVLGLVGVKATGAQVATIGFGVAVKGLLASTGIGLLVVLLGSVATAFLNVGNKAAEAAERTKTAMAKMQDAIRTGNVEIAKTDLYQTQRQRNSLEDSIKLLDRLEQRGRKVGRGGSQIYAQTTLAERMQLEGAGLDLQGKTDIDINQLRQQIGPLRNELKNLEQRQKIGVELADRQRKRIGINEPTPAATTEVETQDEKGLKKAQQDAEQLAKQEQQRRIELASFANDMQKIEFDRDIQLSDAAFEHKKSLIDTLNEYELSGLNDIQARQVKFAQDLKKIQLNAVDAVRKALQKSQEAQLNIVAAQRTAQAAGGGGAPSVAGFTPAELSTATAAASKFTGIANMCSESVKAFYKSLGISLPGVTAWADTVRNAGTTMRDWSKLAPGDIVATGRPGDTPHVGVYTGGQNVFHQSRSRGLKAGNYPDLDYFKQGGYFVRPNGGMKQSSASFSMDTKVQKESFDLQKQLAQSTNQIALQSLEIERAIQLAKEQTAATIKTNIDNIFPVEKQKLDLRLQQMRNSLILQGMPQEYIDYEEQRALKTEEAAAASSKMKNAINEAKVELGKYNVEAAKGIDLAPEQKARMKILEDQIAANEEGLKKLTDAQRQSNIAALESAIATMKQADALKAMEEVSGRINDAVEGVTGTYKSMFKEIAMGGDSVEALKKAQQALADQFLTMVFDMAMKPVEESMKNTLSKMFGVPTEKEKREESIKKMEEQLTQLKLIEANTAVTAGKAPASGATPSTAPVPGQTTAAGTTGGFLTGTAALKTLPFNGQTSGMLQTLPFNGESGFLSSIGVDSEALSTSITDSANAYSEQLSKVDTSVFESANALGTAGTELGKEGAAGKKWHESLGQAVGGLGMAAGAVMGIVAGINQIKEGGTSNVLGGIGMIASMAGSLLGSFGGLFGGGAGASSIVQGVDMPVSQMPAGMAFANGGIAFGGFRAFANGGTVSGPTLGLVGEGKYNEAVVPLPDGRSIPVQLGGRSARDLMGGGAPGMPQAPSLSMQFETTKINGVEYVSREQLEQAMAETRRASIAGGAKQGMSMTLDKIKQSPSTRSRIGMR
jgi:hypothetical protein